MYSPFYHVPLQALARMCSVLVSDAVCIQIVVYMDVPVIENFILAGFICCYHFGD